MTLTEALEKAIEHDPLVPYAEALFADHLGIVMRSTSEPPGGDASHATTPTWSLVDAASPRIELRSSARWMFL